MFIMAAFLLVAFATELVGVGLGIMIVAKKM